MTAARKRTRRSARAAGTRFERAITDFLTAHVDDRIDRRPSNGAKDSARVQLTGWAAEAETERGKDDAVAAVVIVHNRHWGADPDSSGSPAPSPT
ncbi:hypothetical protein [Saccharopolyspora spinosa]|uniref:Uncharacterized protein n=1 Tax=Saccharopolyspora spinosa TaxID=60894 RepID=A0A2N3Y6W1_SACSN|nr:hypothetical protein [Saccharopolyspora spinosa]PKW18608.1 hypothetical protein A8926_6711 [Saccharopolyspora spinosa]